MSDDKQKCGLCRNLERFYVKGDKQFNKTGYGRCSHKNAVVATDESCDGFTARYIYRRRYGRAKYYLNELLLQISALRCIIEESVDEQNKK